MPGRGAESRCTGVGPRAWPGYPDEVRRQSLGSLAAHWSPQAGGGQGPGPRLSGLGVEGGRQPASDDRVIPSSPSQLVSFAQMLQSCDKKLSPGTVIRRLWRDDEG